MFPPYNSLAEVPEAFREHYVMKSGKAVAEVTNDHPLAVNNSTLLSEKQAAETAKAEAERQRDAAKVAESQAKSELASANVVPRGHKVVPNADAELLDKVKALGTFEEVKAKIEEFPTLKEKVTKQERRAHLAAIAKAEGWGASSVDVLELITDLPEIELRDTAEKDDKGVPKKKAVAKVKGTDGVVTEKDFSTYFAEKHSALLPSVRAAKSDEGTELPEHGAGGGGGERSFAADIIKNRYAPKEKAA